MIAIKTINKISKLGLDLFDKSKFFISEDAQDPDAILVRSSSLHDVVFNPNLKAIGRAGAGVNNIPIDRCTLDNIVVFNTPGANANAVKEMVLGSMFLVARNMIAGFEYSRTLMGSEDDYIHAAVEQNKSHYKGFELRGKRFGVVGLGSIGMMVANEAVALGMEVEGFDPFLSVHRAWELSRAVRPCESLTKLLAHSDFITLHMSLTVDTRGLINKEALQKMKKGAVLLNFARSEIVDELAVIEALESGHLRAYVTDFPTKALLSSPHVIAFPHLGASTREAEDNCAIMIAEQISDYLLNGNINYSVNFPNCSMERSGDARLVIANQNIPNMVGQISSLLAGDGLNILEMMNKSRGDIAYNIVDISGDISESLESRIRGISGITMARLLR